jgi:hypothetical protein
VVEQSQSDASHVGEERVGVRPIRIQIFDFLRPSSGVGPLGSCEGGDKFRPKGTDAHPFEFSEVGFPTGCPTCGDIQMEDSPYTEKDGAERAPDDISGWFLGSWVPTSSPVSH